NGNYRGNFSYGDFTCVVEEFVSNTRIETINILENRDSEYAKMAEGVAEKVLRRQGNDVDVVSAATATSKALLKAVENALRSQSYQ
ncbi:MAG: FMN-binding protein, partial [Candidatus Marinimicrobia bacterium]|nr:FMN-binding protein [Candidatus Neomarinimicrobiota bacterium]